MTARRAPFHLAVYSGASSLAGAEESLSTLLAELADHVRVTVIGVDAAVVAALAAARPGAATRLCRPVRNKSDAIGVADHLRVIASVRPDVLQVNLHTMWACQYALLAGIAVPRVRVIAVEHTPPIPGTPFQHRVKRWTSAHLAAHVAGSNAVARGVEAVAGLDPQSVRTIYYGVRAPDSRPASRTGHTVGSIGRLVREKGYDVLLAALATVPDARLRLVGDGPERSALEAQATALGVAERVEFRGWQADIASELAAMDAMAVPSRLEGFGIVAVEAMLAGVPVVASRTGGMPEYIVDDETGVLVDPDDEVGLASALRALLADPDRRGRLSAAGERYAQSHFAPERCARAFEELYADLLAR
jgi:glycosyltransferase involved in cell wall biosynthesis